MHSDQRAARILGALFILTFITSIAGLLLYGPVLDEKDYILDGSADGEIALGALLEVGLMLTNVGTAVVLFPIARRYGETLALSWVASRIVESTIIAVGAISLLSIVTLSRESTADASALLVQGESLVAIHDWTSCSAPASAWASLGLYPLIKGFRTPPAPLADGQLGTGGGSRTAARRPADPGSGLGGAFASPSHCRSSDGSPLVAAAQLRGTSRLPSSAGTSPRVTATHRNGQGATPGHSHAGAVWRGGTGSV